jgi:ATP-dependent DNA ligase
MMARRESSKEAIEQGAVPAEELKASFPELDLPIRPPFPPMEAKSVDEIPAGEEWLYEPKWDGFRCLAFRSGETVVLQSKAGQPLARYFPELVEAFQKLSVEHFVLDGEIVIARDGQLSFDDLLMRIHPAESRIRKLSRETPSTFLAFDLLVSDTAGKSKQGTSLVEAPLLHRRKQLESFFERVRGNSTIRLSPASRDQDQAKRWMRELAGHGFDGVVAKRLDALYASGERTAMRKIKRIRSADCVVGGFRWAAKGGAVGSLLLGLYDENGSLHHVGFTNH